MKKILFLHGFFATGSCPMAVALKEAFENHASVLTPDLPLHPKEALKQVRSIIEQESPDLLLGNSCGSFLAQMLAPIVGIPALLGNPHFEMTKFLKERIGEHQYKAPRKDGNQTFIIDEALIEEFAKLEKIQFDCCNPYYRDRVWGLFGEQDRLAHYEPMFLEHYNNSHHFPGAHTPTEQEVKTWYAPLAMKMLMESENNEVLGQALQELDMTIIGEKEILAAAEVETPQRLKETVEHEFFHEFMKRIARNHKIVYILGEKSEQIKALVGFLKEHYPRVTVSGVFALEDCPGDYESIINEVNGEAADVVISVIPSPQQEEFLMNYKSKMSAKVWYGIGEVTGLYSDTFLKKIFRKIFHKHVLLKRIEQYENEDEERK